MSKELVISANRHETKVALIEDDQLVEVYFQRANEYSLAGSIHKGRVTRVLPGMQSAFVDLGLERDTFLYVSDFFEENGEEFDRIETKPTGRQSQSSQQSRNEPMPVLPAIVVDPPSSFEEPIAAEPETSLPTEDGEKTGETPANAGAPDQRDRRGRRGRRRRTRGRGF